jgi:hypothetical protein
VESGGRFYCKTKSTKGKRRRTMDLNVNFESAPVLVTNTDPNLQSINTHIFFRELRGKHRSVFRIRPYTFLSYLP